VNFSGATLAELQSGHSLALNNNTYSNTSGAYNPSGIGIDDPAVDPDYVNAAGGDFTPQEATLEGTAFPTSLNGVSSFGWPGAIQPADAGSGVRLGGIKTGGQL